MRNHAGFTLLELVLALTITATVSSIAIPTLNHGRRVMAVRSASAELVGLIARTRSTAIGAGGATLVLDLHTGTATIESGDGTVLGDPRPVAARHGIALESDRSSPVRLRYDGLGIGRVAAATIRIRRDGVRATLVVSAYGRVR